MYKYSLDKSSKKFTCPNCGKKSFVRYRETETSNYLNESLGRCDRESKCRYHNSPNGNKPLVNINVIKNSVEPTCHSDFVIQYFCNNYSNNNFINFLIQFFNPAQVKHAIRKYFIATSNHWCGATIFWQVDDQMNVCAGKVMLYNKNSGKRIKKPYPHINWMHKVIPVNNFVLKQCLFGLHNICDYECGAIVCVVESEKTAIVMSILFPKYLWLATGSKSNLKYDLIKPLKEYKIIVYADKSDYNDWNEKVNRIRQKDFDIVCSPFLEKLPVKNGFDLVDVIF